MPTYDYKCEANGRVVEVKHAMADEIHTWGELCQLTGIAPGDSNTPPSARGPCCGGACDLI